MRLWALAPIAASLWAQAPSVESGESRRNENVQINLIDNNALKERNARLGTTATAVTEFTSVRPWFGAEYGNSPAGPIHLNPLKVLTGMHGSAYFGYNTSLFSARRFFQVGPVQAAHENQYGLTTSFALTKRLFLTVEGARQKVVGNVNGNVQVPRADERTPTATDPVARALIQRWINAYPLAAPNRLDIDERGLNTNSEQVVRADTFSTRLDFTATKRDRIFFRHSWNKQAIDYFQFVAGQNPDTTNKGQTARVTWERQFRPGFVGSFSTGFDRTRSLLMPEPNAVGPAVEIGTAFTKLGPNSSVPLDRVQNRFRQAALFAHRTGKHQLVYGGEFTRLQFNGREDSSTRGNWYFRNDFGRTAIENFLRGVPSRYTTAIGNINRGFRNFEQHAFLGDTWQARPDLTITMGMRYQPIRGPSEVNNLTDIPFSCDCNNWAPYLGLAKRLPRKWGVLRANYGLHYGEFFAITLQQVRWNPPNFLKVEVTAPLLLNPLAGVALDPNARSTFFNVPSDLKTPYSHQYNVQWELKPVGEWRVQMAYIGSRTRKLFMLWPTNRARIVPGIPTTTATVPDRRPDQRFFEVRQVVNSSNAYFDAGRVSLLVPSWRKLTVDASYWFSKAIDTGSAYTNTAAGDDARQGFSQTEGEVMRDLKGLSDFDHRHAFLLRAGYQLPMKWIVQTVYLAKTGTPFTVVTGSDAPGFGNVDGSNGSDRPNLLDPSILGTVYSHPSLIVPRSAFAFQTVGQGRGNLGTSTFRRGGISNLNASLSRTWSLKAERLLTFRAESVNLLNTPQFAEPINDLTSPAFGKITNTLNDGRTFTFTLALRF